MNDEPRGVDVAASVNIDVARSVNIDVARSVNIDVTTSVNIDVTTSVNGVEISRRVSTRSTLAQFLREDLGLTGTKVSCELQVCGVCSVLVDGAPVSACTYLAVDVDGRSVETVEGLADGDQLHPLQRAFVDNFALQCGFCTPGFLMMAKSLLERNPDPTEEQVREYLDGNICRCTGYRPIVDAVLEAAQEIRGARAHG